jgi:hypothetical protein
VLPWQRKHAATITNAYRDAPYRGELAEIVAFISDFAGGTLADLNIGLLTVIGRLLGIAAPTSRSSGLSLAATQRSERVLEILAAADADVYLCANGSVDYMIEDGIWDDAPVRVLVQRFTPPEYPQVGCPAFVNYMSIIDPIANLGARAVKAILEERRTDWLDYPSAAKHRVEHLRETHITE